MAAHPHQQRLSGKPRLITLGGYSKATQTLHQGGVRGSQWRARSAILMDINKHSSLVVTVETTGGIWTSSPTSTNEVPLPLPNRIVSEESRSLSLLCGNRATPPWCWWHPHGDSNNVPFFNQGNISGESLLLPLPSCNKEVLRSRGVDYGHLEILHLHISTEAVPSFTHWRSTKESW